jgi:thiamine kinase-like enzyme
MQLYVLLNVLVAALIDYCSSFKITFSHTCQLTVFKRMSTVTLTRSSRSSRKLYSNSNFDVKTKNGLTILYSDLKTSVKEVIRDWNYTEDEISVRSLKGGITNSLYTLTPKKEEDKTVIVRIYGEGSAAFIDRAAENIVFSTLSKRGIGPKFYGTFQNGRVEGYCDAKTLKPEEMSMKELYPKTSTAIAQFHCQTIEEINQNAMLWSKLDSFFDLAHEAMTSPKKKVILADSNDDSNDLESMREETKRLKINMDATEKLLTTKLAATTSRKERLKIEGARFGFDTVLCHNDLLAGNILLSNSLCDATSSSSSPKLLNEDFTQYSVEEKTNGWWSQSESESESEESSMASSQVPETASKVIFDSKLSEEHGDEGNEDTNGITLIDFEYAANNYRAWDIANHFNEFAGFDFNIKKDFPCRERRLEFLRHYVRGVDQHGSNTALRDIVHDRDDMDCFVDGLEVSADDNDNSII